MTRNLRRSKAMRTNIRRTPIVLLLLGLAALIAADRFIGLGLNGVDYAALILVTLFALKGYLQGLVNTVFSLFGYILGAVGAILLSPSLASWAIKNTGLGTGLSERLEKLIPVLSGIPATAPSTASGLSSAAAWLAANPAARKALEGQPWLQQAFQTANPFLAANPFLTTGSVQAAPVTNFKDLLVYSLLRILAVFLLFLAFKLVLMLIGHFITSLMNLSTVLGTANRTAGMALGLLVGFIILYVLVGTVIPFLGSLHFLKIPQAFSESRILYWFNVLVSP